MWILSQGTVSLSSDFNSTIASLSILRKKSRSVINSWFWLEGKKRELTSLFFLSELWDIISKLQEKSYFWKYSKLHFLFFYFMASMNCYYKTVIFCPHIWLCPQNKLITICKHWNWSINIKTKRIVHQNNSVITQMRVSKWWKHLNLFKFSSI